MKLLAISGSLRKESFNGWLLKEAQASLPEGVELEIFDLSPIPLYNKDLEDQGFPESVKELKEKIAQANGVLIASPEYNHSISGVLKNTIDWVSRQGNEWADKPISTMGASDGSFGTVRSQMHLRIILLDLGSLVMPKPVVFVPRAQDKFTETGELTDERTKENITKLLTAFKEWIERVS